MKKIVFFTLLCFICIFHSISAQSLSVQYRVTEIEQDNYSDIIADEAKRENILAILYAPQYYLLEHKDRASIYLNNTEANQAPNSELNLSSTEVEITRPSIEGTGIYKNFETKAYLNSAPIYNRVFLITDTLEKHNWQITNEEKMIGDYPVKKATTQINGKHVVAWYAPELPIPDGPEDFYGLPGLVLEAETSTHSYTTVAISFNNEVVIKKPIKGRKVSREEYQKIYKEKVITY